jgi:hypothetical protein
MSAKYVGPTGTKRVLYYVAFFLGVGAFPFHHYVSVFAGGVMCLAMLWNWPNPPSSSDSVRYGVYVGAFLVYLAGLIWM